MTNQDNVPLRAWLTEFADCVRKEDPERGKYLFCDSVYCFGSYADSLTNMDDLVENQWKKIWPNTSHFRFHTEDARYKISENGDMGCIMVPWSSLGYRDNGEVYKRPGRVTILLLKDKTTHAWLAFHTHYSLNPSFTRYPLPTSAHKPSQINTAPSKTNG